MPISIYTSLERRRDAFEKYRCSKGGYNFDTNNDFLTYTRKMGQITEFDLMANNFGEISNPPS
jgi:hypothetical protein